MQSIRHLCALLLSVSLGTSADDAVRAKPIHLDDIHFIVSDEVAAVAFFRDHFGAREMAHPGVRFDLVRFLSLKWQGPTITITPTGPYPDLPPERNQRWLEANIITPHQEQSEPAYGARWLALATPSLSAARDSLIDGGVRISKERVVLPMELSAKAFSVRGPDGAEIVIVERPEIDFGNARYAIDHLQFLVEDVDASAAFFQAVFAGTTIESAGDSHRLTVADATLVLSEPETLGLSRSAVLPRKQDGTIRIGIDHLGFLYQDVASAVEAARTNGVTPVFPPQRYVYKGQPTVYTFTAFSMPDEFSIEMVQADGRIGPHSYYVDQNRPR